MFKSSSNNCEYVSKNKLDLIIFKFYCLQFKEKVQVINMHHFNGKLMT